MSNDQVIHNLLMTASEVTATVDAPIETVDIADWVLNLPDAEYQRCAPGEHIAAGRTTTDDGRPMSINVENVGGSLVIQHYVAEVHEPHHCHMVSLSDAQTAGVWTKPHVTWDLRVEPIDDKTCRFINTVTVRPTQGFLDLLAQGDVSFDDAAAQQQAATHAHNQRETPLYAASMGRKALTKLAAN
ncbi:SRPBCC family protein [Streptomyces canus]|uniref:SRPBCC family protein n=1 Tax=Streptomyces canus TaxID=58343 RepID=UPI003253F92A